MSRRGWLVVVLVSFLVAGFLLFAVQPFLAVTHRMDAKVLVVEGWVHEYAIRAAADEFRIGSYQYLLTTGGPVTGSGGYTTDLNTTANVGAGQLRKAGVPAESVQMVPSRVMGRDRTYHAAVALRNWLRENGVTPSTINVLTEHVHARRTRLLFQEALGKDVKIGIIAVASPDYDAKLWWRYSDGVREVIGETIAYGYARFFFSPSRATSTDIN